MTTNTSIDKIISPLIPAQFPAFYRTDGHNFISFVQSYYQWLEQSANTSYVGSVTTESRSLLDYLDVDLTQERFLKYFKDTYLADFPQNIDTDWRLFIKHALDFYGNKGTEVSYELLFRVLYNQEALINAPGKYMFRTSNATWKVPRYIEVTDTSYFAQLQGKLIRGTSGGTAVVESVAQKIVNKKTVNIINLSSLRGNFVFGDVVFCESIPEMIGPEAPIVVGSLSVITIEGGGINFNVGDELAVLGTGLSGIARVAATTFENGKVTFNFVNGGYGFTTNAIIIINNSGTGGTGASFKIGDITDSQIVRLNTDVISGMVDTRMDLSTSGLHVNIASPSGAFLNGERASGTIPSCQMNVKTLYQSAGPIANGDILTNGTLGIANLSVYISDGSQLCISGNTLNINAVTSGITLSSNSGVIVEVEYVSPKANVFANGIVIGAGSNSSLLSVYRPDGADIGYYVPGMIITGNTSGSTATVTKTTRLTDWGYFPGAMGFQNLDSVIGDTLSTVTMNIGRIAFITAENPGDGYVSAPSVSIIEPLIYDLQIDDGGGGYWGYDALVTATSGSANGVVTALTVIDSGFGYFPDEYLILLDAQNSSAVYGKAIVHDCGVGKGYWLDTQGFLSDIMKLQDSYYYQAFSYEVQTERMLQTYEQLVKDLVHPVGYRLFGTYAVHRSFENVGAELIYSAISQPTQLMLTADDNVFKADTTEITADEEGLFQG